MKMRSPSRMLGFIDPVGTSFQSATTDRTEQRTSRITSSGLTHSRQIFRTFALVLFSMSAISGSLVALGERPPLLAATVILRTPGGIIAEQEPKGKETGTVRSELATLFCRGGELASATEALNPQAVGVCPDSEFASS